MLIDTDTLRAMLSDYYGTAGMNGNEAATIDLMQVQAATDEGLFAIAHETGLDPTDFEP